jgi:(2Fe-2S) ferredoxin
VTAQEQPTRRIVLCTGPRCAHSEQSHAIAKRVQQMIAEYGAQHPTHAISFSTTHCTGICRDGPVMVVYPEKTWYCLVDETRLARIFNEHIIQGKPVLAYTFDSLES